LVKAVKMESAVAVKYWWGVGSRTSGRWRQALEVEENNPGTHLLRRSYGHSPWLKRAWRNSRRKVNDPIRRAKISAYHRGRPKPPHVVEGLRRIHLGKPLSAKHRRKVSKSLKRRVRRPWAAWEDALLELPMSDISAKTGRTIYAIQRRRREVLWPNGRPIESQASNKNQTRR